MAPDRASVLGGPTQLPRRNLDILRALAVLGVLTDHTMVAFGHDGSLSNVLGLAGVHAFFVHTSLVLMSSLERDGAPGEPGWMRRFYIRRAFRLYPLAWVLIVFVTVLRLPRADAVLWETRSSLSGLLANIGLVQNLAARYSVSGVMWTLPVEIQMYAVLPFCYLLARRREALPIVLLMIASVVLACMYTYWRFPPNPHRILDRVSLLQFTPSFVPGVVAFWLLRNRSARWLAWGWVATTMAGVLCLVSLRALYDGPWAWVFYSSFAMLLGFSVARFREIERSVTTRIAGTIADYSYGIYLFHGAALSIGVDLLRGQPRIVQMMVAAIALVLVCVVMRHVVEKPMISVGKRFARQRFAAPQSLV